MPFDEVDEVIHRIQAVLEGTALQEQSARFQVSALEERNFPLSKTYEMAVDMEHDAAIEGELERLGFEYYPFGEDGMSSLWISEEYGLMVFLEFDTNDGRFYNFRLLSFDVISEAEEIDE